MQRRKLCMGRKKISSGLKEDLHTEKNIIRPNLPDVMQV